MSDSNNPVPDDGPLVRITDVSFGYGNNNVLSGVTMTAPRGAVTVVLGPSGCGKSTLLGLIGGRLKPADGQVMFDGEEVAGQRRSALYRMRRRMGMLFQHSALLTDYSVFENVAFPIRENTDLPSSLIRILVKMKLEQVGLRGAAHLMPAELSGGMARRVALARAIALDPLLVMYDEPFTGLDPISLGVTVKLIRDLNDALGLTSIVVTHDVEEACRIADHMVLLGRGKELASGKPGELLESREPHVEQFMKGLPDGPVAYHYPAPDFHTDLVERR